MDGRDKHLAVGLARGGSRCLDRERGIPAGIDPLGEIRGSSGRCQEGEDGEEGDHGRSDIA